MKLLITGGSGDLGTILCPQLLQRGYTPTVLDVRSPEGNFDCIKASITDRAAVQNAVAGIEMVIHIAAWHGVHEFREERDAYEFWDLNVTGTFNLLQAAADAGMRKFIFISSTSIDERFGLYGHTKVIGEEMVRAYADRHGMQIVTLRPRAFIPHWNRVIYNSYIEWAKWFWGGAVHIDDVAQAVLRSVEFLDQSPNLHEPLFLTVDGAYEYSEEELNNWDSNGPGETFKGRYGAYVDLVCRHGLEPAKKPKILDISETRRVLKYDPQYSLKNLLSELEQFGAEGPPSPISN